ncbi:rRNA maturation RNase YbeY [Rurimicrobium arvi]|uniref:Endoribonuclease YbeY n=1 Tax=Rurimicrobium arvi TaxID=2049916 RepID=A0ABP8MR02_9BACT
MSAHFYEQEIQSGLKNKRRLAGWLNGRVQHYLEGIRKVRLSYIFCSDEALLKINREYLDHDTYTDIITFDMSESESEVVGEIYISVERVAENAQRFSVSYENELHRVIFHGMLHLCGFGDKKPAEKAEMRTAEDECLEAYFAA